MKPRVLITGSIPKEYLQDLDIIADITTWSDNKDHFLMPRAKLLSEIEAYNALINFAEVKVDEEFVRSAPKLRIISNCSIGFDNLNLPLLTSHCIWASNAPGFFNYPVAEYVFAGIIVISRRLLEADDFVRKGGWTDFQPGRWDGTSLKEKTVGIVGLGTIGKEVRLMIKGMGAKVIYFSPMPKEEEGWVTFEDLLSTSDIISIHVPLNSKTVNLFDSKVIAKIKKGAIIVNTSRGGLIDQNYLIKALQSKKIAGAVLDVFQDEPNVPNDLKRMKNVLLTPHVAGGTQVARERSIKRAIQNVVEVLKGNKPMDALNKLPT